MTEEGVVAQVFESDVLEQKVREQLTLLEKRRKAQEQHRKQVGHSLTKHNAIRPPLLHIPDCYLKKKRS